MSSPEYYLSWRGRQSGPLSLEEIIARLRSGEVSGMHLIHHEGGWIPLEEFLAARAPRPVAASPPKPPALPVNAEMERRISELEAELHRRGPAPPALPPQYAPTVQPPAPQWHQPPEARRISAMAVVAFICSLASGFFLFPLWPVAATVWLLSVIFGHASLSECQRNPALSGRGLAIAALAISYLTLLLVGAWQLFLHSRPL